MRYYTQRNGQIYQEIQPLWDYHTRTPQKSWHRRPFQSPHAINHWRDIEGSRMSKISNNDLYFKNWFKTRIRESACLPLYYTTGYRFIRLTRDFPAGFKCPEVPMNLAEVSAEKAYYRKTEKAGGTVNQAKN